MDSSKVAINADTDLEEVSTTATRVYQIDITDRLEEVSNLEKSLDYPNFSEFRVGEVTLTFNDDNRTFDPRSKSNIYRLLDKTKAAGYRLPVKIYAGFLDSETVSEGAAYTIRPQLVFQGEVHKIDRSTREKTVSVVCIDMPQNMQDDSITGFGLEKTMSIQGYDGSSGGEHPIPLDVAPFSMNSDADNTDFVNMDTEPDRVSTSYDRNNINGYYVTRTRQAPRVTTAITPMNHVKTLKTSGFLTAGNFVVSEDQINTELPLTNEKTSDGQFLGNHPVFNFKAPYRDKTIEFLIKELLSHYDIENSHIELPNKEALTGEDINPDNPDGIHFTSNGRVGYDIELEDPEGMRFNANATPDPEFWRWSGFVTDFVANKTIIDDAGNVTLEAGKKFMLLYSGRQTGITKSRIIEYDVDKDEYTIRFTSGDEDPDPMTRSDAERAADIADNDREFWSITASDDFNTFYVLGTEAGYRIDDDNTIPTGTYNSSEHSNDSPNQTHIWRFTRTSADDDLTFSEFVAQNESTTDSILVMPQLAKYLHLGFGRPGRPDDRGNNRLGFLPFSNRLILNTKNNVEYLYYLWANRTAFGVARKSTATGSTNAQVMLISKRDTYNGKAGHNVGGCAFYIEEVDGDTDMLYAAFNHINYEPKLMTPTANSRLQVLSVEI